MEEVAGKGSLDRAELFSSALNSNSPNAQSEALRQLQSEVESTLPKNDYAILLTVFLPRVLSTYPRHYQQKIRKALQEILRAYLRHADLAAKSGPAIGLFLQRESQKAVVAPTNALVLLEWASVVQEELARHAAIQESPLVSTCTAAAVSLDKCLGPEIRGGIRQAAVATARRGIRSLIFHKQFGQQALEIIVQHLAAGSTLAPEHASYIGLIASITTRDHERKAQLQAQAVKVIDYYVKTIIGSKIPLQPQQVKGLNEFIASHVSKQDLDSAIVPAIEKAALRSPEGVMQGPVVALAKSLSDDIDISDLILGKLLKPIVSAMASTNANVRDGAARSLSALLARKQDSATLVKIVSEIVNNIRLNKNQEVRGLLADCLCEIAVESGASKSVVDGLTPLALKEANEGALRRETGAVAKHLAVVLSKTSIEKTVADAILKGCAEKRAAFKKLWLLGVGSALLNLDKAPTDSASSKFVSSVLTLLQDSFAEFSSAPLPAVQAGTISTAFVLPALIRTELLQPTLYNSKPENAASKLESSLVLPHSFLLNVKVYSRLTNTEDQRWALRALLGVTAGLKNATDEGQVAWARAILYLLLDHGASPTVRKETGHELAARHLHEPRSIGKSIILGILDMLKEGQSTPKNVRPDDEPRVLQFERAITCISPPRRVWEKHGLDVPQEALEDQAILTMVLLGPELIHGANWIDNCLLIGVDPGQLASKKHEAMMKQILSYFEPNEMSKLTVLERAACRAAANLAFVAPETITPALVKHLASDLDAAQLDGISETEAIIGRTPEGVLVVDPLAKANGVVVDKNRKDYAVLKWEEEVRSQLAKKKGAPQKKLTSDQQAKVDAQLTHEKSVRQVVWTVSAKLRRGASLVHALAVGPPTDARLWMSPAVEGLAAALQAGAILITDDELTSAYLACANRVTDRLGPLRPFIGITTLRSLGPGNVPEELEVEALEELGTRVLYRLRFAAEQRPFDTPSLAYSLPLIFSVLDKGAVGKPASIDDADAQVLLALEYLSFQMSSCADTLLPRVAILQRLVSSMQRYPQHYRLLKDALVEFCAAAADNITPEERDVLLKGVTLPETSARSAVLQAIQSELELTGMEYSVHIWIACQDEDDENAETALAVWEENEFEVTNELINTIPDFLFDRAPSTRSSAAKALTQALAAQPQQTEAMRIRLQTSYQHEAQPLVPKRDKFGIVQKGELIDHWERRSGLALAFKEMAAVFEHKDIIPFMEFMVSDGPLCDRHSRVREEMVRAGTTLVTIRGKEALESLMNLFETVLQGPDKATQESDLVNEAVIVLYGSLAQHLPGGDSRLKGVIEKLIETLSTPSESVQFAVAGCLPPLVRAARSDADPYISMLTEQLFNAKKYAVRRGAAYGLAGIVKGKGLGALRSFRIMSSLHSAVENKKSPESREGALFGYELLSLILGRTFEPYVVEVLPQLLACFGDPVTSVRDACLDTAKTCFANLSSYGVHQVLPRLLEGLDETQ